MASPRATTRALPAGWEEWADCDGTPYFYHAATKQSSWVHPDDIGLTQFEMDEASSDEEEKDWALSSAGASSKMSKTAYIRLSVAQEKLKEGDSVRDQKLAWKVEQARRKHEAKQKVSELRASKGGDRAAVAGVRALKYQSTREAMLAEQQRAAERQLMRDAMVSTTRERIERKRQDHEEFVERMRDHRERTRQELQRDREEVAARLRERERADEARRMRLNDKARAAEQAGRRGLRSAREDKAAQGEATRQDKARAANKRDQLRAEFEDTASQTKHAVFRAKERAREQNHARIDAIREERRLHREQTEAEVRRSLNSEDAYRRSLHARTYGDAHVYIEQEPHLQNVIRRGEIATSRKPRGHLNDFGDYSARDLGTVGLSGYQSPRARRPQSASGRLRSSPRAGDSYTTPVHLENVSPANTYKLAVAARVRLANERRARHEEEQARIARENAQMRQRIATTGKAIDDDLLANAPVKLARERLKRDSADGRSRSAHTLRRRNSRISGRIAGTKSRTDENEYYWADPAEHLTSLYGQRAARHVESARSQAREDAEKRMRMRRERNARTRAEVMAGGAYEHTDEYGNVYYAIGNTRVDGAPPRRSDSARRAGEYNVGAHGVRAWPLPAYC